MECKLGQALGCEGMKADGTCSIHFDEGVARRVEQGVCVFKNIRSPQVGIYAPKSIKMLNPIKAAKAAAKATSTGA